MDKILELLNCPMLMEPERFSGFLNGYRALHHLPKSNDTEKLQRKLTVEGKVMSVAMNGGYATTSNGIAVIAIAGPMFKGYGSWGYADQNELRGTIQQAVNDPSVGGIMLLIDSPGGSVAGTSDLAAEIRAADAVKPVCAYIEDMGASAAYWTAASAREIYSNGGMVGSIGVVTALMDMSKMAEGMGIKVIPIVTGKYKAVGMPGTEVKPDEIAYVQELIDSIYSEFVGAVSSSRGMRADTVRKLEAKVFVGQAAVENKLVDGIMSFDKAMSQLGKMAKSSASNRRAKALLEIEEMQD